MVVSYGIAAFFFFQAEDGIRGYKVTGVQTCALPIFDQLTVDSFEFPARGATECLGGDAVDVPEAAVGGFMKHGHRVGGQDRSEERRVGKEWRAGRAPRPEQERGAAVQSPEAGGTTGV